MTTFYAPADFNVACEAKCEDGNEMSSTLSRMCICSPRSQLTITKTSTNEYSITTKSTNQNYMFTVDVFKSTSLPQALAHLSTDPIEQTRPVANNDAFQLLTNDGFKVHEKIDSQGSVQLTVPSDGIYLSILELYNKPPSSGTQQWLLDDLIDITMPAMTETLSSDSITEKDRLFVFIEYISTQQLAYTRTVLPETSSTTSNEIQSALVLTLALFILIINAF